MQSSANTALVGLIVILSALLLSGALLVLGGAGFELFSSKKYEVLARFDDVTGIDRGMAVTANGRRVGIVQKIIEKPGRIGSGPIDVQLKIDRRVALRSDARAVVEQPEFLGDSVLVLDGLSDYDEPAEVQDGGVILGVNSGGLAQIVTEKAEETTEALVENVNIVQGKLLLTLDNVNALLEGTTAMLGSNQSAIQGTMKNVHAASANMVALSAQLAQASASVAELATDPRNKEALQGISANLYAASTDLKGMSSSMNALMSDPKFGEDMQGSLAATRATLENVNASLSALGPTVGKVNTLLDSSNETIKAVGDVARGVSGIVGADSGGAVSGAKSKLQSGLSSITGNIHHRLDMDSRVVDSDNSSSYSGDDLRGRDINATLGYGDLFAMFGYDSIGLEDGGANFMIGKGNPNKGLSYKTGAYRGEMGTGASYRWGKNAGIDGYMFDANDPKYNLYGKIPVGKNFSGMIGVEDVTGEQQLAAGVGVAY
ncbi:MAG: MlaD family protein [bacterium]|nr:MlaD family protein [bacterium]